MSFETSLDRLLNFDTSHIAFLEYCSSATFILDSYRFFSVFVTLFATFVDNILVTDGAYSLRESIRDFYFITLSSYLSYFEYCETLVSI